jgi:hypothetical protein
LFDLRAQQRVVEQLNCVCGSAQRLGVRHPGLAITAALAWPYTLVTPHPLPADPFPLVSRGLIH